MDSSFSPPSLLLSFPLSLFPPPLPFLPFFPTSRPSIQQPFIIKISGLYIHLPVTRVHLGFQRASPTSRVQRELLITSLPPPPQTPASLEGLLISVSQWRPSSWSGQRTLELSLTSLFHPKSEPSESPVGSTFNIYLESDSFSPPPTRPGSTVPGLACITASALHHPPPPLPLSSHLLSIQKPMHTFAFYTLDTKPPRMRVSRK